MPKIRLKVTEEILKEAVPEAHQNCPIALAAKEYYPIAIVTTETTAVSTPRMDRFINLNNGPEIRHFVKTFDAYGYHSDLEPFTIEIDTEKKTLERIEP